MNGKMLQALRRMSGNREITIDLPNLGYGVTNRDMVESETLAALKKGWPDFYSKYEEYDKSGVDNARLELVIDWYTRNKFKEIWDIKTITLNYKGKTCVTNFLIEGVDTIVNHDKHPQYIQGVTDYEYDCEGNIVRVQRVCYGMSLDKNGVDYIIKL